MTFPFVDSGQTPQGEIAVSDNTQERPSAEEIVKWAAPLALRLGNRDGIYITYTESDLEITQWDISRVGADYTVIKWRGADVFEWYRGECRRYNHGAAWTHQLRALYDRAHEDAERAEGGKFADLPSSDDALAGVTITVREWTDEERETHNAQALYEQAMKTREDHSEALERAHLWNWDRIRAEMLLQEAEPLTPEERKQALLLGLEVHDPPTRLQRALLKLAAEKNTLRDFEAWSWGHKQPYNLLIELAKDDDGNQYAMATLIDWNSGKGTEFWSSGDTADEAVRKAVLAQIDGAVADAD